MRSGRIASLMAAGLAAALVAGVQTEPRQTFTRGAHTTRRQANPVRRTPENPDPDIAAWNREVDRRKAERKARRRS